MMLSLLVIIHINTSDEMTNVVSILIREFVLDDLW